MAQDPEPDEPDERDDEPEVEPEAERTEGVNPSHDLDMVTLYTATTIDSEMEAGALSSLLESNGIPALVIGSPFPNLGYQVQVPRERAEEARRLIGEAEAAGPEAASEAEAASEEGR
jgi:hypothetical protein